MVGATMVQCASEIISATESESALPLTTVLLQPVASTRAGAALELSPQPDRTPRDSVFSGRAAAYRRVYRRCVGGRAFLRGRQVRPSPGRARCNMLCGGERLVLGWATTSWPSRLPARCSVARICVQRVPHPHSALCQDLARMWLPDGDAGVALRHAGTPSWPRLRAGPADRRSLNC